MANKYVWVVALRTIDTHPVGGIAGFHAEIFTSKKKALDYINGELVNKLHKMDTCNKRVYDDGEYWDIELCDASLNSNDEIDGKMVAMKIKIALRRKELNNFRTVDHPLKNATEDFMDFDYNKKLLIIRSDTTRNDFLDLE